jgi:hypothetical protein
LRESPVSRRPGEPLGEGPPPPPPFFILFEGLALNESPYVSWGFLLAAAVGEASVMFNLFRIVKITNIYFCYKHYYNKLSLNRQTFK